MTKFTTPIRNLQNLDLWDLVTLVARASERRPALFILLGAVALWVVGRIATLVFAPLETFGGWGLVLALIILSPFVAILLFLQMLIARIVFRFLERSDATNASFR